MRIKANGTVEPREMPSESPLPTTVSPPPLTRESSNDLGLKREPITKWRLITILVRYGSLFAEKRWLMACGKRLTRQAMKHRCRLVLVAHGHDHSGHDACQCLG